MSPRAKKAIPVFIEPMAAESRIALPEGPEWAYELKLDGYRAVLLKSDARVRIRSRNDKDLSAIYPKVVRAGGHLSPGQLVLDGEIVALDRDGRPSFQGLQRQ